MLDLQIEIPKSETTDALSFASKGLTSTAILALIGLMAVLGSFVIVARMVLGPLLKVREAMAMLAGGNNQNEVPPLSTRRSSTRGFPWLSGKYCRRRSTC